MKTGGQKHVHISINGVLQKRQTWWCFIFHSSATNLIRKGENGLAEGLITIAHEPLRPVQT